MPSHSNGYGYDRVRAHASEIANARIDRATEGSLRRAGRDPELVRARLQELDAEWDIDRAILITFAAMGGAALLLGLRRDRRWRLPLMGQIGSLLAYALVGWSPQTVVLRRLGFRTRQEIDQERHQLTSRAPVSIGAGR
jgi:hypothetical protein